MSDELQGLFGVSLARHMSRWLLQVLCTRARQALLPCWQT